MFPSGATLVSPTTSPAFWFTCQHEQPAIANLNIHVNGYFPDTAHLQTLTAPRTLPCVFIGQVG